MDWRQEVRERLRRKNSILIGKDSALLEPLRAELARQSPRVAVLWALDLAEETVCVLEEKFPGETRPRCALEVSRAWAAGAVKMRQAQRAILDCHAAAKEVSSPSDAALFHAVGQACSVVHTEGHALGFCLYDLTSLILTLGADGCRQAVEARVSEYSERLKCRAASGAESAMSWAPFLAKRERPARHPLHGTNADME